MSKQRIWGFHHLHICKVHKATKKGFAHHLAQSNLIFQIKTFKTLSKIDTKTKTKPFQTIAFLSNLSHVLWVITLDYRAFHHNLLITFLNSSADSQTNNSNEKDLAEVMVVNHKPIKRGAGEP